MIAVLLASMVYFWQSVGVIEMDANTKYKRWGWGAVIGLIAVILVAGLIIAVSMKSPKQADEIASSDDSSVVSGDVDGDGADNGADNAKSGDDVSGNTSDATTDDGNAKDDSVTSDTSNKNSSGNSNSNSSTGTTNGNNAGSMPKSGPTDNILAIIAFAVIATLITYNVVLAKDFTLSVK